MKAYTLEAIGSVEGVRSADVPVPVPGPNEVLVKVHARSLNYRDMLIVKGLYPIPAPPGTIPVSDGAGEVAGVGERVSRVAVGDRVCGTYFPRWRDGRMSLDMAVEQFGCTRPGMLAEYVLADEQALVKIPEHLGYEEASTLPCAAVTAWASLNGPRPLVAGETVLTIGTGGVALFALQFAKLAGARVIAITSSDSKAALLKTKGADEVVDYVARPDWDREIRALTHGRGVDHVVETGALSTLPGSLAACAADGQVALVAALGNGTLDVAALRGLVTVRRLFVGSRAHFEAMNRAIAVHRLRPAIDRVFPFSEAPAAYRHFEDKRHIGKVVIGA